MSVLFFTVIAYHSFSTFMLHVYQFLIKSLIAISQKHNLMTLYPFFNTENTDGRGSIRHFWAPISPPLLSLAWTGPELYVYFRSIYWAYVEYHSVISNDIIKEVSNVHPSDNICFFLKNSHFLISHNRSISDFVFRSCDPKSRSNIITRSFLRTLQIGLRCPSIRPSVCPSTVPFYLTDCFETSHGEIRHRSV